MASRADVIPAGAAEQSDCCGEPGPSTAPCGRLDEGESQGANKSLEPGSALRFTQLRPGSHRPPHTAGRSSVTFSPPCDDASSFIVPRYSAARSPTIDKPSPEVSFLQVIDPTPTGGFAWS